MNRKINVVNAVLIALIVIAFGFIYYLIMDKSSQVEVDNNSVVVENVQTRRTVKRDTPSSENKGSSIKIDIGEEDNVNRYAEGRFFYNQLNTSAKSMYTSIENNINSLKSGYDSIKLNINTETAGESFQSAWDAFEMDHPDIFYVETKNLNLLTKSTTNFLGTTKYEYTIQPKENESYFTKSFNSRQEVEQAIQRVEAISDNVVNNADLESSRYDKIKYVHDYIVENAHYDQQDMAENSTLYGLLVNNAAICEGYAKAFKYMMDKLNIPCVVVYGEGISSDGSSEYHAWNEVQMENGVWYAVDTSWDDPIIIGNGKLTDEYKYKYFLVGSSTFSDTHIPERDVSGTGQNFSYPELSNEKYN